MPQKTIQIDFCQIQRFNGLYTFAICKPPAGKIPTRLASASYVSEKFFSDEVRKLEAFQQRIGDEIRSALSVSAKITLVEPKTIERSLGKAKRVFDRRELAQ